MSARGSARCVGLHRHMARACGEGVNAHRMASMTWVVLCAFSLSGRARVETRSGWGSCARAVVAFEWNTCSPPPALAPAECEMECGGSAENCEMRNGWGFFGHACGRMGKAVDELHGVLLLFSFFLTSLLLSSSSGCVAYGMGCVAVSLAPPPRPGPMTMAAPPSPPLLLTSLLLS